MNLVKMWSKIIQTGWKMLTKHVDGDDEEDDQEVNEYKQQATYSFYTYSRASCRVGRAPGRQRGSQGSAPTRDDGMAPGTGLHRWNVAKALTTCLHTACTMIKSLPYTTGRLLWALKACLTWGIVLVRSHSPHDGRRAHLKRPWLLLPGSTSKRGCSHHLSIQISCT